MSESWRVAPLPKGWSRNIRPRILARDQWTCQRCGSHATHVDHVIPASAGGSDDDANLATLCEACHRRKTSAEANAAKPRRRRQPEQHPGMA